MPLSMYDFDYNYNHRHNRHNRHHHHWQKNEWLVGTRCALHCLCLEAQTLPTPPPFKEQARPDDDDNDEDDDDDEDDEDDIDDLFEITFAFAFLVGIVPFPTLFSNVKNTETAVQDC